VISTNQAGNLQVAVDSKPGSRFWPIKANLRAKITLGVVIPLTVILGIFTFLEASRHRETELHNLSILASQSGKVIESSLRNAMLESNFSDMQKILDAIGDAEEFRIVYLLDSEGKVIFAPHGVGVGDRLNNNHPACQACHVLPPQERPSSVVVTDDNQRVFRSMYPIKNAPECTTCHDPKEPIIGLLLTDIPFTKVESALFSDLRENLLWWVGTILVTVVVVNLAMSNIVVSRLQRLATAIAGFDEDHLSLRLPPDDPDEIGQLSEAFNNMSRRIEIEVAENRSLSDHLYQQSQQRGKLLKHLITAQEDERKRVARELHDDLGQALGALALQTEAVEKLIGSDTERAIHQLNVTRDLIKDTTDSMYELILALRPSILDDLGLISALQSQAERSLEGSEIDFELNTDVLTDRLEPELETTLYRIYQEALNNVRRHSGAKKVSINIFMSDGYLESEIRDDGYGFDMSKTDSNADEHYGWGLLGIKERVSQWGGELEIITEPGRGTLIRLRFPITEVNGG
jgi:signal transduction histidine kinase